MVNLELINSVEKGPACSIQDIERTFYQVEIIKNNLLKQNDVYMVNNKSYINKSWYRKLAIAFSISTKIITETRIEKWDIVIYNFTIRATTPLWRYIEASSSCSSIERDFKNIEHEVRTISQTRASNRAIWDLIWLYQTSLVGSGINTPNTNKKSLDSTQSNNNITDKQKRLLIKLIEWKYKDEVLRNAEYKKLHWLSKNEARINIRDLIESWVEY